MSKSLALKYRPSTFSDLIGQKLLAIVLQKMVEAEAVPKAILFSGPSGSGKTSSARILAAGMNPSQAEAVAQGTSNDVIEIDAASNGGVGDIRKLLDTLRYQGSATAERVVIYDEAHSITRDGWNALLKPTEEEFGTTFIFVTTEPNKIPGTVLSRLHEFEFRRVSPADIMARLQHIVAAEDLTVTPELLQYVALYSEGNVRSAVSALDQVSRAGLTTVQEYTHLRGIEDQTPHLVKVLLTGDHAAIYAQLDRQLLSAGTPSQITAELIRVLSDLLVLRSGGTLPHQGPALQLRKDLSFQLDPERIVMGMKVLWDLKTRVRGVDDATGDVLLALTLISDVFTRGRKKAPVAPRVTSPTPAPPVSSPEPEQAATPRKLTLDEIRARVNQSGN